MIYHDILNMWILHGQVCWWSTCHFFVGQPAIFGGETNMNHGLKFKPPPHHSNVSHKNAHHIFGHLRTSYDINIQESKHMTSYDPDSHQT